MQLSIEIEGQRYNLSSPIDVTRYIEIWKNNKYPSAFHLPDPKIYPVQIGDFVGDVTQEGSCNVNVITYSPHNLTHIECSAHLSHHGTTVDQLNQSQLHGLCYLIDLSTSTSKHGAITEDDINPYLNKIQEDVTHLAIKTKLSTIPPDTKYSGEDPLYLDPNVTKLIRRDFPNIKTLILDLPSADREEDGGKLLAHRHFFDVPLIGTDFKDTQQHAIVELAYFRDLDGGLYYSQIGVPNFDVDAQICSINLFPISIDR